MAKSEIIDLDEAGFRVGPMTAAEAALSSTDHLLAIGHTACEMKLQSDRGLAQNPSRLAEEIAEQTGIPYETAVTAALHNR